jgi:hypothetical protein
MCALCGPAACSSFFGENINARLISRRARLGGAAFVNFTRHCPEHNRLMNFDQTNFLSASVSCLLGSEFGQTRTPSALQAPNCKTRCCCRVKKTPEFNAIKCSDADAALSTRRAQRRSIKRHKGTQMESQRQRETLHIAAADFGPAH